MKTIVKYIEKNHGKYGVALFVMPALLVGLAVVGAVTGSAQLTRPRGLTPLA